jgi:SAM-dependent methyltransferase
MALLAAIKNTVLSFPGAYALLGIFLGATRARTIFVQDFVKPKKGDRILDLGCGPGDILEYLPDVDYVGVDMEARYIEAARARFGNKAQFIIGSVDDIDFSSLQGFDTVLVLGLLHHIDDTSAAHLLKSAGRCLKPGGKLITWDPCFHDGQGLFERWLQNNDRGKFVRTEPGYLALLKQVFPSVKVTLRHDLLTMPYTHLISESSINA